MRWSKKACYENGKTLSERNTFRSLFLCDGEPGIWGYFIMTLPTLNTDLEFVAPSGWTSEMNDKLLSPIKKTETLRLPSTEIYIQSWRWAVCGKYMMQWRTLHWKENWISADEWLQAPRAAALPFSDMLMAGIQKCEVGMFSGQSEAVMTHWLKSSPLWWLNHTQRAEVCVFEWVIHCREADGFSHHRPLETIPSNTLK